MPGMLRMGNEVWQQDSDETGGEMEGQARGTADLELGTADVAAAALSHTPHLDSLPAHNSNTAPDLSAVGLWDILGISWAYLWDILGISWAYLWDMISTSIPPAYSLSSTAPDVSAGGPRSRRQLQLM